MQYLRGKTIMRRITYSYYAAGVFGALAGYFVYGITDNNAVLSLLAFAVVAIVVYFIVNALEDALYKVLDKGVDAAATAMKNALDKNKEGKNSDGENNK